MALTFSTNAFGNIEFVVLLPFAAVSTPGLLSRVTAAEDGRVLDWPRLVFIWDPVFSAMVDSEMSL